MINTSNNKNNNNKNNNNRRKIKHKIKIILNKIQDNKIGNI